MIADQLGALLVGLLLAAWTLVAGWAVLSARARQRRLDAGLRQSRRLARMIDEAPALPLLVRADGRIEAPVRLAHWLGLEAVPQYLSEMVRAGGGAGLTPQSLAELTEAVRNTQRTGAPFHLSVVPSGSRRSLALRGHLADPQISPGGAALIWVFDASDSESELARLRAEAQAARGDFHALVGLIEAAPMPMWFREPAGDGGSGLRLVNSAYVRAVGATSAEGVIAEGIELVERVDGLGPADVARQAAAQGLPIERVVTATIGGARRALRVTDLPLGGHENGAGGVAGYAVDIEDMEELARAFRAYREAQRAILDSLSAGIAQFDARRQLSFANQPFRRLLALGQATMLNPPAFERLLDAARDGGRLPEVRDYPAWRRERQGWFAASGPSEEAWPLSDGTHLRVVAQPMPDGGLLLIVEDRTETLRISAMRDTLLRTRTATFDSLFEAIAVFAPDGRSQVWNRRFAAVWGLEPEALDGHPKIGALLDKIARRLAKPAQAQMVGNVVRAATLERRQTAGRVAMADGRTLEFAGVPLPDGNGLLTVLDITDSQRAEQALRERATALAEADAVKTRFLANMSYEFRTPLTSIGGFAELLAAGLGGELSEAGRDYVAGILTSSARLTEQIESVLDLTQSEAGLLPLAREEIDLLPFVARIAEERSSVLREAGVTLDVRGDKGAGKVVGDTRRLGRALGHLIDNAIAASPRDGHVLVELARHRARKQDRARIVITDHGPGMDSAELARALEGVGPGNGGGTRRQGLGLPLARRLIEAHGGTLELTSEPGHGVTATVELP